MTIILKPGEKLDQSIVNELKEINAKINKTKNFLGYKQAIQELFQCKDYVPLNESQKYYLGGFLEGESSISVGAKKGKGCKFGAYLDPGFNVTQHVNGVKHLFESLSFFGTGRIRHKSGSNATLVFEIDTRKSLQEKLVPFYKEYVIPFACEAKRKRFESFCYLLDAFDQKKHLQFDSFVYELAPIWDEMRMQKGQSNETFRSLEDFQQYCIQFCLEKENESQNF
jgi:hypothetical protein